MPWRPSSHGGGGSTYSTRPVSAAGPTGLAVGSLDAERLRHDLAEQGEVARFLWMRTLDEKSLLADELVAVEGNFKDDEPGVTEQYRAVLGLELLGRPVVVAKTVWIPSGSPEMIVSVE